MRDIRVAGAVAAILSAASFVAPARADNCVSGICVSGQDNGSVITVSYHVQNGPVTHVNIRTPDGKQFEGGPSGSFNLQRFAVTKYAIQKCVRGSGLFGHSTCGAWVNFHHNSST